MQSKDDNFRYTVRKLGRFSEEDISLLTRYLTHLSYSKNQVLLKEGKTCQAFYFNIRGSFRQFQINEDGDEITLNLFVEND